MRREEIEKLLGGHATGSLTPEERQELFAAALEDQTLFDQLAHEEALREVLNEPGARVEILSALDDVRLPWYRRLRRWLESPVGLTALAGTAAASMALAMYLTARPGQLRPALVTEVRKAPEVAQTEVRRPDVAPPAPAPALQRAQPHREMAAPSSPAPKESVAQPAPPREVKDSVGVVGGVPGGIPGGVVGGVPGGVIGGILPSQRMGNAPPPPPPPPPLAEAEVKKEVASADSARQNQLAPFRAAAPAPPPARAAMAKSAVQGASAGASSALSARALFDAPSPVMRMREESSELRTQTAEPSVIDSTRRLSTQKAKKAAAPAQMLPSAVAMPHLGLRYSILRATPGATSTEVDSTTVFTRGDQVRLAFESNDAGYLYVLQSEAGGGWRQLAGERIERRTRRVVPAQGALVYDEPGPKQLYVFFSRVPEPGLAALDPLILDQRVRASQVVQKGDDQAVYVVNTNAATPSQQLGYMITLTYR